MLGSLFINQFMRTHTRSARARAYLLQRCHIIKYGQASENDANGVISAKRPYISKTFIKEKDRVVLNNL